MSGTGKRGPDKLNIIGVVTVGVCGAVLTYVSIVLLTAYYMNDTSQIERQAAAEAPGSLRETVRAETQAHLDGNAEGTIAIERAMALVVDDATNSDKGPSMLVPAVGPSTQPTVVAEYGRPVGLAPPATTPPATTPPATTPATPPPATTPPATTPPAETPATTPPAPAAGSGSGTGTGAPTAEPGANGK